MARARASADSPERFYRLVGDLQRRLEALERKTVPVITDWDDRPESGEVILAPESNIRWRFVKDPINPRWHFVGGPPISDEVNAVQTTTNSGANDLATVGPSVTIPADGAYFAWVHSRLYGTSAAQAVLVYVDNNGSDTAVLDHYTSGPGTGNPSVASYNATWSRFTGTADTTVKLQYGTNTGTGNFQDRKLAVIPEYLDD